MKLYEKKRKDHQKIWWNIKLNKNKLKYLIIFNTLVYLNYQLMNCSKIHLTQNKKKKIYMEYNEIN